MYCLPESRVRPTADDYVHSATATFGLVRTLAGSIGITIGGTVFASELRRRLPQVQGYAASGVAASGAQALSNVSALKNIQPPELRQAVLRAYADSLRIVWIVATPLAACGLACSLIIKVYSMTNKNSTKLDLEGRPATQKKGSSNSQGSEEVPAASSTEPENGEADGAMDHRDSRSLTVTAAR